MPNTPKKGNQHMFSIELNSKEYVKRVALPNENGGNVLIEGFLGRLQSLSFTEGLMVEIKGNNGTLRMDLSEEELERLIPKGITIHRRKRKEMKT